MSEHDKTFMRNFGLLIAGLMIFCVVLIIFASKINEQILPTENPERERRIAERVAPIGGVYAGDTGRAALAEQQAQAASNTPAVAFDGSLDGEMIYNNVCMACHTTGAAGAPKLAAEEWAGRLEKGVDGLTASAIAGIQGSAGYMPPRGGRPDLSDEQVQVTVEWMLDQL